jgi:hypothetical protein
MHHLYAIVYFRFGVILVWAGMPHNGHTIDVSGLASKSLNSRSPDGVTPTQHGCSLLLLALKQKITTAWLMPAIRQ